MSFGFDASLILGQRPPDVLGEGRKFADILQSRQAMDVNSVKLADLLKQRQDEARLAEIYRQNAGTPVKLGQALLGGGFGKQAFDVMGAQSEADKRAADAKKALEESTRQGTEFLSRAFLDVKDQAGLDAAHESLKRSGWPAESLAMLPKQYGPDTEPIIKHLASLGVSSKDRFDAEESLKRTRLMAAAQAAGRADTATRGTVVPGLEIVPGAEPTAEDAKAVKKSVAAANRMEKYIADLEALYNENGDKTEFFGAKASKMKQLVTQIRLEGKTIAELGALSGPDMALMEAIAGSDPTSLGANLKAFFGADYTTDNLKGLRDWVKNTKQGNMEAYGYREATPGAKPKGATKPQAKAKNASGASTGRVVVSNGKETLEIDAADLAAAERDGFRRAP